MHNIEDKNIQLVIVEDELHNSRLIKGLINEIRPKWEIVSCLESIEESVEWLNSNKAPELILMDIQLSDGICFSIFDKVELPPSCRIIFTTAYNEYAIRAFKVNSIDYLLKPIEKKSLENSFLKFESILTNELKVNDGFDYNKLLKSIMKDKKEFRKRFLISGVNSYQKLETKDIAYIYSENKTTFAVDFYTKEYVLDFTLEQLEFELDNECFFRANRKIIINIEAVNNITNDNGGKLLIEILPKTKFDISISRLKASDFKNWMGK